MSCKTPSGRGSFFPSSIFVRLLFADVIDLMLVTIDLEK